MVKRFAGIAVFVLLAAPALGQTAVFEDVVNGQAARVKSDGDGKYKHCGSDCSFVKISKSGGFFLRSRCCHCVVNCPFRGDCDKDGDEPRANCPKDGRSIEIDLSMYGDKCDEVEKEEYKEPCRAVTTIEYTSYPDVMFTANSMFAKPKRGAVHANVDIVFSREGLPEPPEGNTWYGLQYIYDIPVQINHETGERTLVVVEDENEDENIATADLYWYNETGKRAKWVRIAAGLEVPFELAVMPPQ